MRNVAIAVAVLAVSLLAGAEDKKKEPPEPSKKLKEFLGDKVVGILKGITKTEVFRIDPMKKPGKDDKAFHGYLQLSQADAPRADFGNDFAAAALDEKSYVFGSAKGCDFSPGVGLRLWKDKESVDVLLCFSCDEWQFIEDAQKDGKDVVHHEDFDPARAALLKLAKEAFPKDEVIQGLKEKK